MENDNIQFVILPHFGNLSDNNLKYTDALTYIAVRSFDGVEGCFPSYEAIATRASCSRDFVVKSIKRLDKAGFILVKRGKKIKRDHNEVNRYEFSESYMFEQIPVEVFEAELGLHDKAMLITLRQFFRSGKLEYAYSIHYMAKHLGITYKVIKDRIDSLVKLGFIEIVIF